MFSLVVKTPQNARRTAGLVINIIIALLTLLSAFGGYLDPAIYPCAGLVVMTFAWWVAASLVAIVADLILRPIFALIPAAALLCCIGPWLAFWPVNDTTRAKAELAEAAPGRVLRVMNYNVLNLYDKPAEGESNRTIRQMLESHADIIVLQECRYLAPFELYGITRGQIDSLLTLYPYRHFGERGSTILSKTPLMHIPLPVAVHSGGNFEAYRTNIKGHQLTVVNVHLQSYGFTVSDKELFLHLTDVPMSKSLYRIRRLLLKKMLGSFKDRSYQSKVLMAYLDQLDGDLILCGDFNDVPNCNAIVNLRRSGMRDAYAETASGPTITYNDHGLLFRIDHALYRGNLKAVTIERGNIPSSDHYPLTTTYLFNEDRTPKWEFRSTSVPLYTDSIDVAP